MLQFVKYQALGNDYLVLTPDSLPVPPGVGLLRWLCDRHHGIGADGVLYGPLATDVADFAVRIYNPDGSETEKSGNGLRIFARYLWDAGLVQDLARKGVQSPLAAQPSVSSPVFTIHTPGGIVRAQVFAEHGDVRVEMGKLSFDSQQIPVSGPRREVLGETMQILGKDLRYCAATIGNPHCVILCQQATPEFACTYGPAIETEARFPNRTNVQFLQGIDEHRIRIEIWERGAGYTLASGSSSCAAAAAAVRLGVCSSPVTVEMQGGELFIEISPDFLVTMQGPVKFVFRGECEEICC